jgi:hypothetical protein
MKEITIVWTFIFFLCGLMLLVSRYAIADSTAVERSRVVEVRLKAEMLLVGSQPNPQRDLNMLQFSVSGPYQFPVLMGLPMCIGRANPVSTAPLHWHPNLLVSIASFMKLLADLDRTFMLCTLSY